MYKFIFTLIVFFFLGCANDKKKKFEAKTSNKDTIYEKLWLCYPTIENLDECIEYYISPLTDTIYNQIKVFTNGTLDTLKSEFYDINIFKTEKSNVYRANITLHSRFDTLKINQKNQRTFKILYIEFDGKYSIGSKVSKTSNFIEFEYINTKDNHLTGVLVDDVFRDTIIQNESQLNYGKTRILVDTRNSTDNLFISNRNFLKEKIIK
ncbi:hypothetical protein [Flavobacterium orientale]|uniref:Lipoprotein n=1 Tax=Flavobacterium orientale TaxID=1756020 RepID=A0A917DF17_9FLAO|nr:hypothetical protein [Flavobacterium orientale]GGD34925.1 hypothetical protein GCM10011343_25970 [Flavobacterium orientale]